VAAAAVLILVVLNPWLLPPGVRYRFDKTLESRSEPLGEYGGVALEQDLDKSASTRVVIWKGGLQMVREHPVMGVGLTRFGQLIRNYAPLDRGRDAHNAYLITAAELGIPALLLFLAILAYLFWVSNRVYRRHPARFVRATALGLLGGLSGLLMANMFGSRANAIEVTGYAWILAALVARADFQLKAERRRSSRWPGCDRRRT
jgi:O-antigen ligase